MEDFSSLLDRLKKGQMEYFDMFYEQTKSKVFYMAFSILKDYQLSEDITQETYLKFLKHLNKVSNDKNAFSYLIEISKNLSLNHLKKIKKYEDIDNVKLPYYDNHSINQKQIVDNMKKILNDDEFQIVILHVINEMTHLEISVIKNKPLGTILWAYNNAIKKLRRELEWIIE